MTEDFEHPDVEMDAILNAPEDPFVIVEREFNEAEYFQVLDGEPELKENEHPYGVAIIKTTRPYLASRTDEEISNNNTTQSEESRSLASDRADTNRTKVLSACTRPGVVLTKLKEPDFSGDLKFNNMSSPSRPQPLSDAVNLQHRLGNKISKKKSGQSTSSSITVGKTGSGNSKKASTSGYCLKVNGQKNHKCNFCEKVFLSSARLENHIRVHTREKPFKCSSCEKTFCELSSLRTHGQTHTGERPFKCTLCVKAFVHRSVLKAHQKVHTGERPFTCSICAKGFAQRSNLKEHEKIHTGERSLKCTYCVKAFVQRSALNSHEKIHTGVRKPVKCSYCTKGFSRLFYARKHERTHTV